MGKNVKMLSSQFMCVFIPFEKYANRKTLMCAIEVKRKIDIPHYRGDRSRITNYFKQMICN
jgi:hypothetical protein